jgi:hypothetical protein
MAKKPVRNSKKIQFRPLKHDSYRRAKKPSKGKKIAWFVVYDNGYGRTRMAVVDAVNSQQAKNEARLLWNETDGSDKEFPTNCLHVESLKNLADGWIY